jgi:predicted Zn-dependent peptidase
MKRATSSPVIGFALAAALLATCLAARPDAAQPLDRSKPPVLAPPPALKLPEVQVQKLANGLELDVVEMHETPVVDVTLILKAGAVCDPADLPGLATFTAGMLDEGAGKRSSLEIADEFDYLGASFNAFAGRENCAVNLHVPKRRLEAALDLMADVVLRPSFPDSEVTRQRELRRTAILQLRDQPTAISPIAFNAIVYGSSHPFGRPTGGNEASTAALSRDKVVGFYEAWYRPNNARLLVVGDVTPAEARKLFAARFSEWKPATAPALPAVPPPAPAPRTFYLVDKPGAPQSVIRIGHVGVPRSTPDYYALLVMNTMLGGSFTSRLNQNLRETHGYTYGARSGFDMGRMAGPFSAGASVQTAKTDSAMIEFLMELRRIRDEAPPQAELEKAKAYVGLGLPSEFETTAGAAAQFASLISNDLPLDTYDHYIPHVQAVTAADVQRVAQKYLDPDHFAMVIVGDRSQIEGGLKALDEGRVVLRDLWGAEANP